MSPVKEADPNARSLDAAFAEAMGAPPKPKEAPAPPEIDPEAPHGRNEDGTPLEPYGRTKDGKIRRSAAGRPAKDDQPRTAPPAEGKDKGKGKDAEKKDYSGPLAETADAAWLALTFAGQIPLAELPLVGRIPLGKGKVLGDYLRGSEQKIQAQAYLLQSNKAGLVGALNIAAQNNARARKFASRLETGDATWVLVAGAMAMPFLAQTRALWSGQLDAAAMTQANESLFQSWAEQISGAITDAAKETAA